MAIEIVDLPIKNGWIFHSFFVGLPAGIPFGYFTVRHGKSSLSIGTSSVSMGHFPIKQPRGLLIYSHHLFTHISYQIFPLPPIMYIYIISYIILLLIHDWLVITEVLLLPHWPTVQRLCRTVPVLDEFVASQLNLPVVGNLAPVDLQQNLRQP